MLLVLHGYLTKGKDSTQIERALDLILQFLDNNNKREEPHTINCTVAYKIASENEYNKISANFSITTLGVIRRKIAEHYKKPLNTLALILNNSTERYDFLSDDFVLNNIKAPYVFIADFNQFRQKIANPCTFFSQCQYFQESLLEILPQLNQKNAELA